jgi:4-hydroxy-tetrahydrodipicolinate reductase
VRIAVMGAAGRIGSRLVETILSAPGLELAGCLVAPGSREIGQPVAGGGIEYRAADSTINARCDVVIDFSTPDSTLLLQSQCETKPIPFVIGTTGFSERQKKALKGHARHRPILLSDNFAVGFQNLMDVAQTLRKAMPGMLATFGDDRGLRRDHHSLGERVRGFAVSAPPADTTTIRFDAGGVELILTHRVNSLSAYADGALAAAHWLVARSPGPGLYSLADTISPFSSDLKDHSA